MIERADGGPPGGQFNWRKDAYRALSYCNAVNFRSDDRFAPGFFMDFMFRDLSDEQERAILEKTLSWERVSSR